MQTKEYLNLKSLDQISISVGEIVMISNEILKAIKERRSILRFKTKTITDDEINTILEAALWAPSWVNSQPWNFIIVKDPDIKRQLSQSAATILGKGIEEAPIIIVVTTDTTKDPHHYIEDGAAASQNISLAAYSLGYGSYWVGVFDLKQEKNSSEEKIKDLLRIPKTHRVISLLPIGEPLEVPIKQRKTLSEVTSTDQFTKP